MFALVVMALLAQTPTEPIQVAVTRLQCVHIDASRGEFYAGHLAQRLGFKGVRAITPNEIAALLGHERQLALMGCPDDSCRGTAAATLGVDALLIGTVSHLGGEYQLDVRILAPGTGLPLAASSASSGSEDGFLSTFALVASQLADQLSSRLGRSLVASVTTEVRQPSAVKRLWWLPAAGGVGAAAVGVVGLILAEGSANFLKARRDASLAPGELGGPLTAAEANARVQAGKQQQLLGFVGLGTAVALGATAAGFALWGGEEVVTAGVAWGPSGVSASISGVW